MTALASLLRTPLQQLVLGAALTASFGGAGCATVVTGGGEDSEGGAGGTSTTGEPGHPTGGGSSTAIAMLYSEIPPLDPASGSSGTTGGGDIDPSTLYVMLGDEVIACNAPYEAQGCGSHWRVTIAIPPWLQAPGIIDLASPEVISVFSATGPGGGSDCYFGGGSFIDGTLEIVSIDDGQVAGVLASTADWEFDADGPFTASRCF